MPSLNTAMHWLARHLNYNHVHNTMYLIKQLEPTYSMWSAKQLCFTDKYESMTCMQFPS